MHLLSKCPEKGIKFFLRTVKTNSQALKLPTTTQTENKEHLHRKRWSGMHSSKLCKPFWHHFQVEFLLPFEQLNLSLDVFLNFVACFLERLLKISEIKFLVMNLLRFWEFWETGSKVQCLPTP